MGAPRCPLRPLALLPHCRPPPRIPPGGLAHAAAWSLTVLGSSTGFSRRLCGLCAHRGPALRGAHSWLSARLSVGKFLTSFEQGPFPFISHWVPQIV